MYQKEKHISRKYENGNLSPEKEEKVYVDVTVKVDTQGNMKPLAITWEDGKIYEIDCVTDVRKACSLRAGGAGIRYTIKVKGKQSYLFYEEDRWFVERK